jgi:hypothetical protein
MPFCSAIPYPVLPVGFGLTVKYPCSAKMAGFHRVLQLSVQAPWGPPWISSARGYFLLGSKSEGFTTSAWT